MSRQMTERELELADEVSILRNEFRRVSAELERTKVTCVREVRVAYESGVRAGRELERRGVPE